MNQRWARPWFAVIAACVLLGVGLQLFISADDSGVFGGSPLNRALNVFAFFTIQSNVLVGITCGMLAVKLTWNSTVFAVLRLMGVVGMTVTGIVFHVALSGLLDLDTRAQLANQLQHTVVPIMTVVGWVAFGPRGSTSRTIAWLTLIYPLAYMAFTAVRGPFASDFYPYPFTDVHVLGYFRVVVNGLWVTLLFAGLAAAATLLDKRLRVGRGTSASLAEADRC